MIGSAVQSIDSARRGISANLQAERRSALGQFMTPASVARYMASLFSIQPGSRIRLLDPGAGLGALSAAFIHSWQPRAGADSALDVTAYEIDSELRKHLECHMAACRDEVVTQARTLGTTILPYDFIQAAANPLEFGTRADFTHAILNPPYKKISNDSMHRKWLRTNGIETVNLYSAFVALSVQLLMDGGELVAIIPRSFCNGPYYKPFREFIRGIASIEHIHLFGSRNTAFKDDEVLQENVILKLVRGTPQGQVIVSHCADDTFGDYMERICDFSEIVKPGDHEGFIHIPAIEKTASAGLGRQFCHTLADLGVEVSTGPVVDFRMKSYLRALPTADSVPLLYPCHFTGNRLLWPLEKSKKPNAIALHDETRRWLYPSGCYTIVRRFSSKEEKRRVMATVVKPDDLPGGAWIGFENHLNVFHSGKQGLPQELAHGLCAYLNSAMLDQNIRAFSGHTQVNATDLRSLKYPSRQALMRLGRWLKQAEDVTQEQIDERIRAIA